jgi:murein DD-endopeptidase MepM/ murein hydrolase activator NlpD
MDITKKILILIILTYISQYLPGQLPENSGYFSSPLDIGLILSGNFAEIREGHFHSGIDIKTQGVTGQKVLASADGYISRIKIESGGYGKTLYLAHPNGKTTVYAHLDRFRNDINDYVRSIQYARNLHAVNIYPGKDEWPVKKGDLIAFSGNSGYSFGPHLHFEIRNSGNQNPENVLRYGFNIKDTISPKFFSLWMYSFLPDGRGNNINGHTEIELTRTNGRFVPRQPGPLAINGPVGFGIEAYDFLNSGNNRCGLYSIELMVDDKRRFLMIMDEYSFNESRYINSFIDYGEQHTNDRNIQKLFLDPNNRLSMYEEVSNRGLIDAVEPDTHLVRIIIKDVSRNSSELTFRIISKTPATEPPPAMDHPFRYDQANAFDTDGVFIRLPSFSLYTDINFSYLKETMTAPFLSDVHHICNPAVPVHSNYEIAIMPAGMHDTLKPCALIISIDEEGKTSSMGGEWKEGYLHAQVNHFGTFAVGLDTVAPSIIPINISSGVDMSGQSSARFSVADDLSGIKSYDGYIDNKWALLEYEAKNDLIFYIFDKDRLSGGTMHELELYIIDNKDNLSYYYAEFYW